MNETGRQDQDKNTREPDEEWTELGRVSEETQGSTGNSFEGFTRKP